jgi:hypothetical protein
MPTDKTITLWSMGAPLTVLVSAIQAIRPCQRKPSTTSEILVGGMFLRVPGFYLKLAEKLGWNTTNRFSLPKDTGKWTELLPEPDGKVPPEPDDKVPPEPDGKVPPEPKNVSKRQQTLNLQQPRKE